MTAFSEFAIRQAGSCASCGKCAQVCDIMRAVSPRLPGGLARELASGKTDDRLAWFVPRCSLCGRCSFVCPEGVDFPQVIIRAREEWVNNGVIDAESYRPMWVDCDWNAITLFRDSYSLDTASFSKDETDIIYAPGCSLLNEAFELTGPVLEWLGGHCGREAGLLPDCCGMPLLEMGLLSRYRAYEDWLWAKIRRSGARDLVLACPNCYEKMADRGRREGVRVRLIYELMAEEGFEAPVGVGGIRCITVHDSCPARGGKAGEWVRSILAGYDQVEMRHCGDDSICCGSGGAVSTFDFSMREVRADRRRAEIALADVDACVCYCMSSCSTLQPAAGGESAKSVHVLELALGQVVDHEAYQERVAKMWEGELGARNSALLMGSRSVCEEGKFDGIS